MKHAGQDIEQNKTLKKRTLFLMTARHIFKVNYFLDETVKIHHFFPI